MEVKEILDAISGKDTNEISANKLKLAGAIKKIINTPPSLQSEADLASAVSLKHGVNDPNASHYLKSETDDLLDLKQDLIGYITINKAGDTGISGSLYFNNGLNLDTVNVGDSLSIGGVNAGTGNLFVNATILNIATGVNAPSTINYGHDIYTTHVFRGAIVRQNETNLAIADKLVTYNVGGLANTGYGTGWSIEENGVVVGYHQTTAGADGFLLKAPRWDYDYSFMASPTAPRTITLQNGNGTMAYLSDIEGAAFVGSSTPSYIPVWGGDGVTLEDSLIYQAGTTVNITGSTKVISDDGFIVQSPSVGYGLIQFIPASLTSDRHVITNTVGKLGLGGALGNPVWAFYDVGNITRVAFNYNGIAGATIHVRGEGATSATKSLLVQNSALDNMLVVLDNGNIGAGTDTPNILGAGAGTRVFTIQGDGSASTRSGRIELSNARANGSLLAGDEAGRISFVLNNNTGGATTNWNLGSITMTADGVGGAQGFGGKLSINTKSDNTASSPLRVAIDSSGRIGVGLTPSKGYIEIKAGTAAIAPFVLTSGVNNTNAQPGAFEYNGTNLFFTRTGTTRENILCASAVNVVSPTLPNRTITVNFNGTDYFIAAKTTNN